MARKYTSADFLNFLFNDGNWIRFPKEFLSIMTTTQAILLAFLISVFHRVKRKNLDHNDWFYCKEARVQKELYLARSTQMDALRSLEASGYIVRCRHGGKGKRYFWINMAEIFKDMLALSGQEIDEDLQAFLDSNGFKKPPFIRRRSSNN